jgi:hypothetical protein
MKLYIITLFQAANLTDKVIKVFSTKENLDRWMQCAKAMDYELFGDRGTDVTQQYRINECELDNLDYVSLLAESRNLGASIKTSPPQ